MRNEMLNVLINLQKQGVQLHLTEDGWKEFVKLMEEEKHEDIQEVV